MKSIVEIFSELGIRLKAIPEDIITQAAEQNEWFCQIPTAIDAIVSQMLNKDKIERWLSAYNIEPHTPKRVAIIMAGNIPAVGFADLMYVIASGNIPVIKYSSKDYVLMHYIVELLLQIEPQLIIDEYNNSTVDAVIATGSDSAALHFKSMFGDIATLIRGSRHSVALLTGKETAAQLEGLSADIFTYSGLGCRNVSLIFAPENYSFTLTVPQMPAGFNNNYIQTRALMTMQGKEFTDLCGAIAIESDAEFPKSISCINICRYNDINRVKQWIEDNNDKLQCVVSSENISSRTVDFGRGQYPELSDYADEVDVMKFLLTL